MVVVASGFVARARLRSPRHGSFDEPLATGPRLRRFVRPYRAPLAVATILILVETAIGLASPWPLKVVVDNAIGHQPLPTWLSSLSGLSPGGLTAVAAAAGVALVAASGLIGYLTAFLMGAAAERVGADLRAAAFDRLQHLSMRFHDRNRTGDLVSRLTSDVSRVQDALVAWFERLLPEALTLAGMLAVLFALNVPLALGAVAVIPPLVIFVELTRPRIKAAQRAARDGAGRVATLATDVLRNVRAVQAFSRQREEAARFRGDSDEAASSAIAAVDIGARFSPVADVVLAMGTAFVLWLGVVQVSQERMSLGTLLVALAYLSSLYGPIRSLSRLATTLAKGAASRERIEEILARGEPVPEDPHPLVLPAPAASGSWPLELREVEFAYRTGVPVLRGVSLKVEPGETVCVVGPTGVGKSTLLALTVRFYDPDGGGIELGGIDVRNLPLSALRRVIALVPQDPWILDGTIAQNVAFGRSGASFEDVLEAGRVALVEEFAGSLPDGYHTVVGEGGSFLSGGQRRRVALARALLRKARVLLLDEPTSGLDAESEARVMEAIRRAAAGRTVLMVSHRLQLAAVADRVVVVEDGRVAEEGRPADLVAGHGRYARLWGIHSGTAISWDIERELALEVAAPSMRGRR